MVVEVHAVGEQCVQGVQDFRLCPCSVLLAGFRLAASSGRGMAKLVKQSCTVGEVQRKAHLVERPHCSRR